MIYQAGEVGRLLQVAVGPGVAGLMLGGIEAHRHFYDSNEDTAEWLRSVLAIQDALIAEIDESFKRDAIAFAITSLQERLGLPK